MPEKVYALPESVRQEVLKYMGTKDLPWTETNPFMQSLLALKEVPEAIAEKAITELTKPSNGVSVPEPKEVAQSPAT